MSYRRESYERAQGNNGDSALLSATGKIRQTKVARNNMTPFDSALSMARRELPSRLELKRWFRGTFAWPEVLIHAASPFSSR
jgi:hypothetical protein